MISIRYGDSSPQIKIDAFYVVSLVLPDKVEPCLGSSKVVGLIGDEPIVLVDEDDLYKAVSLISGSGYETIEKHSIRRLVRNDQNPEVSLPTHYNRAYWQTSAHLCGYSSSRRDLRWLYVESHLNTMPFNLRRNNTEKLDVEHLHRFLREDVIDL